MDELERNKSFIETAFMNMNGSKVWSENYELLNMFINSMPGATRFNERKFINVVEQACTYIPKETHYFSDNEGILFLDRFGKPVYLNLWDNPNIVNRNKVIFGPSGSGKSFFINNLIDQSLAQGNHVVVIDIGHSYKRTVEINGGKYFDSEKKENLSFNIFTGNVDNGKYVLYDVNDEDDTTGEATVNLIYSVIKWIWKKNNPVTEEQKTILKKMIRSFYDYINENNIFPDFKAFFEYISVFQAENKETSFGQYFDYDSLRLLLEPYAVGDKSYLLNAKESIDILNDRFIVFDLENVKGDEDLFNLLSILITDLVMQKIKKLKGVKKSFIIDEALDFLKSDMGEFIAYLYRTFRKKEGEVYLAAQNVSFLDSASKEIQDSIKINTDTKIILDHRNYRDTYKDLQRILSLTDYDIKLLDSVTSSDNYREFFVKTGNKSQVLKLSVSPESAMVYTSKEKDVKEIEKLFNKYGSLETAIKQYVEDNFKK